MKSEKDNIKQKADNMKNRRILENPKGRIVSTEISNRFRKKDPRYRTEVNDIIDRLLD